jgi:hypothetical protein
MAECQNTPVCIFDPRSPRISAYQIHESIYKTMGLLEDDVNMIQIVGSKRRVYIKFVNNQRMTRILQDTNGTLPYRHDTGEQSTSGSRFGDAGNTHWNAPPEVNDHAIKEALLKFGDVVYIKEENWTHSYRYKVSNGIRLHRQNAKSTYLLA